MNEKMHGKQDRQKDRKRTRHIMKLAAVSLALCLFCGCSGSRQQGEASKDPSDAELEGVLNFGYFYEEDGILFSSAEHFMYSEWKDPMGFDYICRDLTCDHRQSGCTAKNFSSPDGDGKGIGFYYQDKLILIRSVSRQTSGSREEDDGDTTVSTDERTWETMVYEADKDGSNRKEVLSFPGSMDTMLSQAAVLINGKLYFAGDREITSEYSVNEKGGTISDIEAVYDKACYCVDLADYSVETTEFELTKGKTYNLNQGVSSGMVIDAYDGYVYALLSLNGGGEWYRINSADGASSKILSFESGGLRFVGAIGNTIYYTKEGTAAVYAMEIGSSEEKEVVSLETEDAEDAENVVAYVLDGQLLVETAYSMDEGAEFSEYTLFDPAGKELRTYHYDEYVSFMRAAGDHLLSIRSNLDVYWCRKEELADLLDKSIYIGNFFGRNIDNI